MLQGIRTPPPRRKRIRQRAPPNARKSLHSENKIQRQNLQQESIDLFPHQTPYPHHRFEPDGIKPSDRRWNEKCVLRKGYKKQCATSAKSTIEPTRAMASVKQKCVVRKGYKKRCKPVAEEEVPLTLADAHKVRVQKRRAPRCRN